MSEERDTKLRGYLEVKLGSHRGVHYRRLTRKCWRRQWVVMDMVETIMDSPALIARIYGSHHHEDRSLPTSTVTLTDIHALHRAQSRSHQFAFSIDGNGQSLILSGLSETDTHLWMKSVRDILWPPSTHAVPVWQIQNSQHHVAYEVSLIDNVHSDIARLRGFYGHLVVEGGGREVLLVEARSGMDQVRWPIKALKKWFVAAKVNAKEDANKIVVIITHKNNSSGEGIFSFYSPHAREIVETLTRFTTKSKKVKVNPLKAFFRRSSSVSKVKRSTSVVVQSRIPDDTCRRDSLRVQVNGSEDEGGFSERQEDSKKKSVSESDLLSARSKEEGIKDPQSSKEDGYYRSFDDIDDIDLGVLANSNSLEAAVVLRHKQTPPGLRYSFNSSTDSGRTSDTYAETSNGSVTSSSSAANPNNGNGNNNLLHQNRLYSSTSNCSGDSGTHCSMSSNSDSSNSKTGNLEVLKEQESPLYPPFDRSIYGHGVSIKNQHSKSPPPVPPRFATVRKSYTLPHNINSIATNGPQLNPVSRQKGNIVDNTYENLELSQSPKPKSLYPSRPKSLVFSGNASMGRFKSSDSAGNAAAAAVKQQPMNRTLARLSSIDPTSAPTTPEYAQTESPRLARFLGLASTTLSNSTPMDLESRISSCESLAHSKGVRGSKHHPRWQSNDGLMTPGSLQCTPNGSPCRAVTPTPMRLLRNPLTVAGLAGPNHLLNIQQNSRKKCSSSSSMYSLSSPSHHHRILTPQIQPRTPFAQPSLSSRFLPRSATLENLESSYGPSWKRGDSLKTKIQRRTSMRTGDGAESVASYKDPVYMTMKRSRKNSQDSEYLDMNKLKIGSPRNVINTTALVHTQPEKFESVIQHESVEQYEVAAPFQGQTFDQLAVLVPQERTLEEGEEII